MEQEKVSTENVPVKYKDKGEQVRFENYEKRRAELIGQGYQEHVGTISIVKANIFALVTAGPFAILVVAIYMMIWKQGTFRAQLSDYLIYCLAIMVSMPIHEGIHGLTWRMFCKGKWKSIYIGFIAEALTPFCHCKEPLRFWPYIIGGLMPFFVLGIGVSVVGIVCHSALITVIGATSILAAGGDTTIALMLLRYRKALILDHPKQCGFVAFTK
ncbi:MAG: DUF3267 domain-containing protein [bacterium]|nr:DUF3267 domain-containing protein [bacterium]